MDIFFKSKKLKKICNERKAAIRKFGKECGTLLIRRLAALKAAKTLENMRNLGRCHELKGDMKNLLSIDLKHPYRLIFEPCEKPIPKLPDGGLDWSKITSIKILGVEDTHNGKSYK